MAQRGLLVAVLGLFLATCDGFASLWPLGAGLRGGGAVARDAAVGLGRGGAAPGSRSPLWVLAAGGGGGGSSSWWEERGELPFECTGCGKCCRVKGDVWVDPEEAAGLAAHLALSLEDFTSRYTSRSAQGWVQLLDRGDDDAGCVFLGDDNKTCGVYEARPLQCRVYPFFPRLLSTPEAWNGEVVTADEGGGSREWGGGQRLWTAETGGCEGMREVRDVRLNQKKGKWVVKTLQHQPQSAEAAPGSVPAEEIREQLRAYEQYFLSFPHEFLLSSQRRPTSAADELLEAFGQPPPPPGGGGRPELFYDQIFAVSNLVERELAKGRGDGDGKAGGEGPAEAGVLLQGPVHGPGGGGGLATGGEEGFKAGYLSGRGGDGEGLSAEEEGVVRLVSDWAERHVIRLELCPFAKPAMETGRVRFKVATGMADADAACRLLLEEADLVMQTPEDTLPTTLIAFPDLFPGDFLEWNTLVESIEDNLDEGGAWEEVGEHVLIAAFHPEFEFGGLEQSERVLNWEKRAPVPVINLLRTEAIDRGIDKGVTAERIAGDNEETLLSQGLEDVKGVYESLGREDA